MYISSRHPERSRPKGGVVEGPPFADASQEEVPPLRLAMLGSGRDDEFWVALTALTALTGSFDQLGQPSDDTRRLRRGVRRHAGVVGVVPDAAHAELLWRHDLPFVVVAHHPGVAGGTA